VIVFLGHSVHVVLLSYVSVEIATNFEFGDFFAIELRFSHFFGHKKYKKCSLYHRPVGFCVFTVHSICVVFMAAHSTRVPVATLACLLLCIQRLLDASSIYRPSDSQLHLQVYWSVAASFYLLLFYLLLANKCQQSNQRLL